MKYFEVYKETIDDLSLLTLTIKKFVFEERIPFPVSIQITNEHRDFFMQNKYLVVVSSLALLKL